MILLQDEIKHQIKSDNKLFLKSCELLDVKQATLNKYLDINDEKLTDINFLNMLALYTGKTGSQLLTGGKISSALLK